MSGERPPPDPRSGLDEQGDWSPAFPGQRPPFEPGNDLAAEAPVTHGVYSERRLIAAAEQEYAQLRLTFTPWDPAYDLPARTLAEIRARTVLAYRWLDEHDLVDDRDEVRAILKELPRWERRAMELFRELAMTVKSRAELERVEAETDMLTSAEVNAVLANQRAAFLHVVAEVDAGRIKPGELRQATIAELYRRAEQLKALDDHGTVEGSSRRLEPPLAGEEGLGGA